MNNSETKLINLIDIIRKDSGINNAIDAMEQLSLILLLKYFYDIILADAPKRNAIGDFKKLFYNSNCFNSGKIETDFSELKNVWFDIRSNVKLRGDEFCDDGFARDTWNKVEDLLNNISFRIRSVKILEILLSQIEDIYFNEQLAEAYDTLVVKMINDSISSGAFHSPKALVTAIVKVIKPSLRQSIYDPALGTGRFIVETHKIVSKHSETISNETLYTFGRDISPFACLVGSLNLLLNGIDIKNISLSDSLLDNDNSCYDIVLSGVPFGKASHIDRYEHDYYGYSSNLEAMFLKHSMRKLGQGGKAALIVPDGLLFNRTHELLNLRHTLLTRFNLHSILSLPSGTLAPYAGVKVSVLFFENTEPENDIWFYELKTNKPLNKTNQISDHDLVEFIELFSKRIETANSYLVNKRDILNREGINLSIEPQKKVNEVSDLKIFDEITFLKKKKEEFDLLLSEFIDSLNESKQAEFVKKFTLGELLKTKAGKPLKKIEINEEGRFPVYGGNGLIGYFNEYNREGENIIIGRVGAQCGNIHFIKGPIWLTNNSFSVEINSSLKVHLPYLAHVLRSLNLNKLARGSAQPSISFERIKEVEISLPTYEQQVELCEWFEEILLKNNNLLNSIKLQADKYSELSNYSIISNCINGNN
ncbi:MAG: N-6 DNA methylase [Bacteroidetes bacterium]|nr:N-6 DNA methylase [Bacteroidota bacterium]